jgi:lipoprotein-releasing system ATP-binding protein
MNEPVLIVRDLKRAFTQGGVTIEVLRGVNLSIARGEIVALLGPSGSGKSTLLQAVGLLEGGFEGSIRILGEEASKLDGDERTRLRRDALGFVYQFHHLLPDFSAQENVILPQLVRDVADAVAMQRAARSAWITNRASSQAASSSASPSPARWPTGPRWCWRMNQPAT